MKGPAFCIFYVLAIPAYVYGQAKQIDSALIRRYFNQADAYLETAHYDSAQFYLNKIHNQISYREPSFFSYFLTSRQAEIYYYDHLPELGMQEARRAINIAEILNDDILKGDAHNFAGLFFLLTGRPREAIDSYKKSISYALSPPYPKTYLALSEPHHFYGNLAEVYEHLNLLDSAVHYNRLSLFEARRNHSARGLSTGYLNLANAFLKHQKIDSAKKYYTVCRDAVISENNADVALNAYGGLANCAAALLLKNQAEQELQNGFELLKRYPEMNSYYALLFLESAIKIYDTFRNYPKLTSTFKIKSKIQNATDAKSNTQVRNILLGGLKNETRILNLEVSKARQEQDLATTRLYFFVALVLLLALAFGTYFFYSRQKLRLSDIRNKISQDLHDEVGATLSGIALYAHLAQKQNTLNQTEKASESLDIINSNATAMVKKLSDIVWAVNPANDSLHQLMQRLEDYAKETGFPKGISTVTVHNEGMAEIKLPMEIRKNIYLIGIEGVNNAIKHSNCHSIRIEANIDDKSLQLMITDDGIGFEQFAVKKGNGLDNMHRRAAECNALLKLKKMEPAGTQIELICKIT